MTETDNILCAKIDALENKVGKLADSLNANALVLAKIEASISAKDKECARQDEAVRRLQKDVDRMEKEVSDIKVGMARYSVLASLAGAIGATALGWVVKKI